MSTRTDFVLVVALAACALGARATGQDLAVATSEPVETIASIASATRAVKLAIGPEEPLVQQLGTLLAPAHLRSRTVDAVAKEIAALDPAAPQAAFAYLSGAVPIPIPLGSTKPKGPVTEPEAVLLASFRHVKPRSMAEQLTAAVVDEPTLGPRLVAWRILAEHGAEGGFDAWEAITSAVPPAQLASPAAQSPCRAALIGVLRRDGQAFAELDRRFGELPVHLRALACDAVARAGRSAGVRVLLDELPDTGRAATHVELAALDAVARVAETTTGDLLEEELARIRPLTRHPEARVRRAALHVLARVFDLRSHTLFTDALVDGDDSVRAAAHWALTWIAASDLGTEPGPWTNWFEDQLAWFEAEYPRLHRAIEIRVPEHSIRAARTLSERPWFRHPAAREVATLCSAEDTNLVRQGCVVLRELRSPAAIPFLLDALTSDDVGTRDAVRGTLVAITGHDLPAEPAAWRAALSGR